MQDIRRTVGAMHCMDTSVSWGPMGGRQLVYRAEISCQHIKNHIQSKSCKK